MTEEGRRREGEGKGGEGEGKSLDDFFMGIEERIRKREEKKKISDSKSRPLESVGISEISGEGCKTAERIVNTEEFDTSDFEDEIDDGKGDEGRSPSKKVTREKERQEIAHAVKYGFRYIFPSFITISLGKVFCKGTRTMHFG